MRRSKGIEIIAALALTFLALLSAAAAAETPARLRIGLLPGESALTVIRVNEPLRAYLEHRLGMPVDLVVGTDYAATGEALRFGRIDVAYLGPVSYVLGRDQAAIEPFAKSMHSHGATFTAVVITASDSHIATLADLRGKEVAFGDVASTSGHWAPRLMLYRAGLIADDDYEMRFLGAHDAVAFAVARGTVDAGGVSRPILERLITEGRIEGNALRIIAESSPIPEYAWTFRPGLDPGLRQRIRDAFLAIEDPAVLRIFNAERFVSARDSDYEMIRGWLRTLRRGGGGEGG